jgi:hypothetical protein
MYHSVRLMMYYMDAAGFAPVIRHSGGVRMNEQEGGKRFALPEYLLHRVSLAHIYAPRMLVIVV